LTTPDTTVTEQSETEPSEEAPEGPTTVEGLIYSLADVAKTIQKRWGIPINSSVQLVALGLQYHIQSRALPTIPDFESGIEEPAPIPESVVPFPVDATAQE
jgi:hypothetical protein